MEFNHKLRRAKEFAFEWHGSQKYDIHPYYYHLDKVLNNVCAALSFRTISQPNCTDIKCAAILHDVLEDSQAPAELLNQEFGDTVFEIVQCLTLGEYERREDYLERVKQNDAALLIKKADTLANLTYCLFKDDNSRASVYIHQMRKLCE